MRTNLASVLSDLGGYGEAETELRAALVAAEALGLVKVAGFAQENLGLTLARLGRLDEAAAAEADALAAFSATGDDSSAAVARCYQAIIDIARGDLASAEERLLAVATASATHERNRCWAQALLAAVLLATGRPEPALAALTAAITLLEELGGADQCEAVVRLAHAAALAAGGRPDDARRAAAEARRRLLERAARISDETWRASFLARVPENAETLALAAALDQGV